MEATVTGDSYVLKLSAFVRANESILSGTRANTNQAGPSWLPSLTPAKRAPAIPPKPLLISLHHLSYLLLRFDALGLPVGKLDEPLPPSSSNRSNRRQSTFSYISAKDAIKSRPKSFALDAETASISSVRSTLSRLSLTPSASSSWFSSAKPPEPDLELKRLYSAFTKLPALEVVPALETGLIEGFDDQIVPDTLTPLDTFRNLQSLTLTDIDPKSVTGWDRLACQLKSLTINRGGLDDLEEFFINQVAREAKDRVKSQTHDEIQGQSSSFGQSSADAAPSTSTSTSNGDGQAAELDLADSLPHLAWHFLQHLALPSTSLTFFADLPLRSLRSLDLSHNLLNAIPPSLSGIPHLQSLDLTGNLIEDCRGASQVLPSIRILNLRSNRIEYLSGLEGCVTLRQIDLRDNDIYEATEVGRLAQLNYLQKVWIKNNPVYEEYPDARVEIFLEFAKDNWPLDGDEGNTIALDNESCGYFERKRVVERLPLGVNLASANESRESRGGRIRSYQHQSNNDNSIDSLLIRQRKERQTTPRAQEPSLNVTSTTIADEPTSTKVISSRRQKRVSPTDKAEQSSSSPPLVPVARHRAPAGGSERRRHRRIVNLDASNEDGHPSSSNSRSSSPHAATNAKGKRREEISEAERLKREVLGQDGNGSRKEQSTPGPARDKSDVANQDEVSKRSDSSADTAPSARNSEQRPDGNGKGKSKAYGQLDNLIASNKGEVAADEQNTSDDNQPSQAKAKPSTTSQDSELVTAKKHTSAKSQDAQDLRARIEGLKREVGDDWLRVLSRGN
ncbi:unnamed protein product [Sympodiomycopsis kandeliae]